MTWDTWKLNCPYKSGQSPIYAESCIVRDTIQINSWGKMITIPHTIIYGECSAENCKEYQELYGERRVY